MGVFQILKLKIRGVKISGTSYIVRKHFRIIGNGGRIQIDGRYGGYIGPESMMTCAGTGEMHIGFGFRATEHLRLTSLNKVVIGNNVLLGSSVTILDCNHGMDAEEETGYFEQDMLLKEVHVEDGVWCGDHVIILPGVTVGKHSIIGAGSVVTKSIPSYCIAAGNPARVIKKWDFNSKSWKRTEEVL